MGSSSLLEGDLEVLSRQLGRPARDVAAIAFRCVCGNPIVASTAPRLSIGIPFPTTFYLTHPALVAAVSRLEARGEMVRMNERLQEDADLARDYRQAHDAYLRARDRIAHQSGIGNVPEIQGISAGGMPERVKCLHALLAHALAEGPGSNRLGEEVLAMLKESWTPRVCACDGAWDTEAPLPARDLSRHVRRNNQGYARRKKDKEGAAVPILEPAIRAGNGHERQGPNGA